MITSVSIRNWKAYDELALELRPGTTFLVSRNGVGKTSFLEAVVWALLGSDAGGIDADAARRGERDASVKITLQLPRLGDVTLTRNSLAPSGRHRSREEVTFVHGAVQSEGSAEWANLLAEEWSASPAILGKLMVLPEHAIWRELSDPAGANVKSAIRGLLGLDAIEALKMAAGAELAKAKKAAQDARAVNARELQDSRDRFALAQQSYDESQGKLEQLRAALSLRNAHAQHLAARAVWETELAAWAAEQDEARASFAEVVSELRASEASTSIDLTDADDQQSTLSAVDRAVERLQAELAATRALIELTERHRRDLSADDDCPVCLRPLDSDTVRVAAIRHTELMSELSERVQQLESSRERLRAVRNRLTALEALLGAPVPSEPVPPVAIPESPSPVAEMSDEELRAATEAAMAQAEQLRDALGVARSRVDVLEDHERNWAKAVEAFRRQALAMLVSATSERLADSLTQQAADPLLRLVKEQWKRLPLGDDLDIDDDGKISVVRNGRRLDYPCLSGGEKAQVVLVYRVAALRALTRASVLLLDEPLEHLDPRNRWRFGRMLASLGAVKGMEQTFVTTYEEPLARRLAHSATESNDKARVSLVYLDAD